MRTKPEEFNRYEKSLLKYFECRLVDNMGRVAGCQVNKQDIEIAKALQEEGFIEFGRLTMETIESYKVKSLSEQHVYWVRFTSDITWILVAQFRREQSEHWINESKDKLESEMTKNNR